MSRGGRRIKQEVLALLATAQADSLQADCLDGYDAKAVVNVLFTAICATEPKVRWQAIVMMGRAVDRLASVDFEAARVVMRRFLWSLNDESGGVGWGAPEAMAECMCANSRLAVEYVHMLISYMHEDGEELLQDGNYLELEGLQRGLLWGIARLGQCRPGLLAARGVGLEVTAYLDSGDGEVRGLAALACGRLKVEAAREALARLQADRACFLLFDAGSLRPVTVGDLARQALLSLDKET